MDFYSSWFLSIFDFSEFVKDFLIDLFIFTLNYFTTFSSYSFISCGVSFNCLKEYYLITFLIIDMDVLKLSVILPLNSEMIY